MSRWTLAVAATALLMPATGIAQIQLGRPVLPHVEPFPDREKEPPPATVVPNQPPPAPPADEGRDLFRAAPGTFDPRFDRLLTPAELGMWFPQSATLWPVWIAPSHETYRRAGEVRPVEPTVRIVVEHRQVPPAPVPAPAPAMTLPAATVPLPAGHKKTLYVIPGCYAGDKPPRRDQLRAGCDMRNVRTISPVL